MIELISPKTFSPTLLIFDLFCFSIDPASTNVQINATKAVPSQRLLPPSLANESVITLPKPSGCPVQIYASFVEFNPQCFASNS